MTLFEGPPQHQAANDEWPEQHNRAANPPPSAVGDFHYALPEALDNHLREPCHRGTMPECSNIRNWEAPEATGMAKNGARTARLLRAVPPGSRRSRNPTGSLLSVLCSARRHQMAWAGRHRPLASPRLDATLAIVAKPGADREQSTTRCQIRLYRGGCHEWNLGHRQSFIIA